MATQDVPTSHASVGREPTTFTALSRSVSGCANVRGPATLQMSFYRDRMVLAAAVGRLLEDDEQRDHGERRDHQQFVIIDVCNDLRLLRDHGIECGASGGGKRIPELCDGWIGEVSVYGGDVLHDFGVIHLRVRRQQAVHYRDAYAGADVARQTVETGAFRPQR
jgi:hypothetical protein